MIKVIGFDFDGTLVQSNSIKHDAFYTTSKQLGDIDTLVRDVLAESPGDRFEIFSHILARYSETRNLPSSPINKPWIEFLVEEYTRICENEIAACPEVFEAKNALLTLSDEGYILFVNSATPHTALNAILLRRNLAPIFKSIYGNPDTKIDNLKKAMDAFRCGPGEMLFVGDNEMDRIAAAAVGCHFIGLENEFSRYTITPSLLIQDMTSLVYLVGQINKATNLQDKRS